MTIQSKIEAEIFKIEEKVKLKEAQISRYKDAIKDLKHLLNMAKEVEGVER